jgi:hypothetical protein
MYFTISSSQRISSLILLFAIIIINDNNNKKMLEQICIDKNFYRFVYYLLYINLNQYIFIFRIINQ